MGLLSNKKPEKDLVVRILVDIPGAKPVESWVGVNRADFQAISKGALDQGGLWIRLDPEGLELAPGPGIVPAATEPRFEPADEPAAADTDDEAQPKTNGVAWQGGLGSCRILVVEDEDIIASLLREWLVDESAEVSTCSDGREALERLRSSDERYDLVVADVVMPGLNGRDLAVAVRHDFPGTAVLLMSGYPTEHPENTAHITRDLPFIAKPYRRGAFMAAARAAIGNA